MPDDETTTDDSTTSPTTDDSTTADEALGLGDAGKRALQAERQRAAAAEARIKELEPLASKARELEDAAKTDLERATGERDTFKGRAETAEHQLARIQAGLDAGITEPDWLARIQGSTPEELVADAKKVAEMRGAAGKGRPAPSTLQGGGGGGGQAQSADDWLREQAKK